MISRSRFFNSQLSCEIRDSILSLGFFNEEKPPDFSGGKTQKEKKLYYLNISVNRYSSLPVLLISSILQFV